MGMIINVNHPGNCDICMKQNILVKNEMKQDEISLKPKV